MQQLVILTLLFLHASSRLIISSVFWWGCPHQSTEPVGIIPLRGSVVREVTEREILNCMEIRPEAFKGVSITLQREREREEQGHISIIHPTGLPTFFIYAESREDFKSWFHILSQTARQSSLSSSSSSIEEYPPQGSKVLYVSTLGSRITRLTSPVVSHEESIIMFERIAVSSK